MLLIMIRVNNSCYRKDLVLSYYHENSLIRCMETWSLAQESVYRLGRSSNDCFAFTGIGCNYHGKIMGTQL